MNQEEMNQAMMEMGMMEQKLKHLDQQLSILEQHILEDEKLQASLEDLSKGDKSEAMLPIGGGIFAKGHIDKVERVLVSVGANVAVEKNVGDAVKMLEKRKEKMMAAREDLANQVKRILQTMTEMEKNLRENSGAHSHDHGHGHEHNHDHDHNHDHGDHSGHNH